MSPITYNQMADLMVPIYWFMAVLLTLGIFYAAYVIILRPWLRGNDK